MNVYKRGENDVWRINGNARERKEQLILLTGKESDGHSVFGAKDEMIIC